MLPAIVGRTVSMSQLIQFYAGRAPDKVGRTIDDIWSWTHLNLEVIHDYIQWLFPLDEPSRFNASAPLVTRQDIAAFRTDPALRARILKSLAVMLTFYGFSLDDGGGDGPVVRRAANFETCHATWDTRGNHNFLRITRILKSLSLFGLETHARAFLAELETLYRADRNTRNDATTWQYWRTAVPA